MLIRVCAEKFCAKRLSERFECDALMGINLAFDFSGSGRWVWGSSWGALVLKCESVLGYSVWALGFTVISTFADLGFGLQGSIATFEDVGFFG